jgi:hypothetical protein
VEVPLPRQRAWLVAAAVFVTSACARAEPRETDGSSVLRHELERQATGVIRLVRFTETGGQRSAFLGVTTYMMGYDAQIEFLRDACYGGGLSARDFVPPRYDRSGLPASDGAAAACFRVHVSKGERREVTGSLPFEKTQKGGWRGPDGQIY